MFPLPCRPTVAVLAVLAAVLAPAASADAATQCIHLDAPAALEICVQDNGTPGVWVNNSTGGTRAGQYFGDYSWQSAVSLAGTDQSLQFSSGGMTPVSNVLTGSGTQADPYVITTVTNLGDTGVQLDQRFTYVTGDRYFKKRWMLRNTGSTTHNDVRFFHGGDTYFGGDDSARSWWSEANRMVYVNNNAFTHTGYMGFYASPVTPSTAYFGGHYSGAYTEMAAGQLSNTTNSAFLDAGYALQWNRVSLAPGQVWIIEAFETWSPAGSLQVLAPSDEATPAGTTVRRSFRVHNLHAGNASGVVALSIQAVDAPAGWSATLVDGDPLSGLAALASTDVLVDVTVPPGAPPGAAYDIRLTADPEAGGVPDGVATFKLSVLSNDVTITPSPLAFGNVLTDTTATRVITIANAPTGTALRLGAIGATNPLAMPFAIVSDTCSFNPVAPGASCVMEITFSPTSGDEVDDSFEVAVLEPTAAMLTVLVDGNRQVGGTFTVTPAAGPGGSLSPGTPVVVAAGSTAAFTVTPGVGYLLADVQGCGGALADEVFTTGPVNTNCEVRASFYRAPVTMTRTGHDQSALLFETFPQALAVTVRDADYTPISGATVTFTVPASGAGAVLSATSMISDASGRVAVTATANNTAGTYQVEALALGASTLFDLTNIVEPGNLLLLGGSPQSAAICTPFGSPLRLQVLDRNSPGVPVAGVTVSFSAPGTGASAALSSSTVVTDANGEATITAGANTTTGSYEVTAVVQGIAPVSFLLTNAAGTPCALPDAPVSVSGSAGSEQVVVSWAPPADTGGVEISNYQVTVSPAPAGGAATRSVGSATTSFLFTNLVNGTAYTFTVRALNNVGSGPASEPSAPVTPQASAPGAPTGVSGTPGSGQIALTWTEPANDGGSPLTGYVVQMATSPAGPFDEAGCPATSPTPACSLTGLINGVPLYFRVAAVNALGTSAPSAVSGAIVPAGVPSAPTALAATPGNGQLTLTWAAPATDGGAALNGYLVQLALDAAGPFTTAVGCSTSSLDTSCTATGLTNGTAYFARVAATNVVGVGAWATLPDPILPRATPAVPTGLIATPGAAVVSLAWTAPADDGGSPLTGYAVQAATALEGPFVPVACLVSGTVPACSATGLTNGTTYYFRVAAINAAGAGEWSAASNGAAPFSVPGVPTNVGGTAGPQVVSVSWTAPADDGGSPVTGYLVEVSMSLSGPFAPAAGCPTSSGATSCVATGLTNGGAYYFRVAAVNATGAGSFSAVSAAVTPVTTPGAPTAVHAIPGSQRLTLTWTPPAATGGAPVVGYEVRVVASSDGSFAPAACPTDTPVPGCVLDGLTNGTAYYVRVAAINEVGAGVFSATAGPFTPFAAPAIPSAPSAVAGSGQATVRIDAVPSPEGGPVERTVMLGYVEGTGAAAGTCEFLGAAGSCVVTGLVNGTSYHFRAVAHNQGGASDPSASSAPVTPRALGPADLAVYSVRGSTVTFVWDPQVDELPEAYEALVGTTPGTAFTTVPLPHRGGTIDILTTRFPSGVWYVRLVGITGAVRTEPSNEVSVVIGPHVLPSAPVDLLTLVHGSTVTASWRTTYAGVEPTGMRLMARQGGVVVATRDYLAVEQMSVAGVPAGDYTLSVAALFGAVAGPESAAMPVSVTGAEACGEAPGMPTRLRLVLASDGRTVSVLWQPPADGGAVTSYVLLAEGAFTGSMVLGQRETAVLAAPGAYHVRVVARNACGDSAPTAARTIVVP